MLLIFGHVYTNERHFPHLTATHWRGIRKVWRQRVLTTRADRRSNDNNFVNLFGWNERTLLVGMALLRAFWFPAWRAWRFWRRIRRVGRWWFGRVVRRLAEASTQFFDFGPLGLNLGTQRTNHIDQAHNRDLNGRRRTRPIFR